MILTHTLRYRLRYCTFNGNIERFQCFQHHSVRPYSTLTSEKPVNTLDETFLCSKSIFVCLNAVEFILEGPDVTNDNENDSFMKPLIRYEMEIFTV